MANYTIDSFEYGGNTYNFDVTRYGTATVSTTGVAEVSCTGFELVNGAIITVRFTGNNCTDTTTKLKLKVNNTTATEVNTHQSDGTMPANAYVFDDDHVYSFVYDSSGSCFWFVGDIHTSSNTGIQAIYPGTGITVGGSTTEATVSANLKYTTKASYDCVASTTTSDRYYAVVPDKSGYLATNVPWTDTNVTQTFLAPTVQQTRPLVLAGTTGTSSYTGATAFTGALNYNIATKALLTGGAINGFPLSSVSTGTTKFLREDGSWQVPAGGSGEVNQNAFSNVVVGSSTIAADSKTDTLTLVEGDGISLTADTTNDKVTISGLLTVKTINDIANKTTTSSTSASNICSFKIPAGTWQVNVTVRFASNANGRRVIFLSSTSTGSEYGIAYQDNRAAVNGGYTFCQLNFAWSTSTEQTVYINGYQNSNSSLVAATRVNMVGIEAK